VHVLPPTLTWHSPALDKAFDEAKAVYFETDTEIDQPDHGADRQDLVGA
jgi:uncharacterized protein YbaP (TraB family)